MALAVGSSRQHGCSHPAKALQVLYSVMKGAEREPPSCMGRARLCGKTRSKRPGSSFFITPTLLGNSVPQDSTDPF